MSYLVRMQIKYFKLETSLKCLPEHRGFQAMQKLYRIFYWSNLQDNCNERLCVMGVKFRFPFNWNSDYSDGKHVFLQFPEIKGNLGTYYQIFGNFLQGISGRFNWKLLNESKFYFSTRLDASRHKQAIWKKKRKPLFAVFLARLYPSIWLVNSLSLIDRM